MNNEYLIFVELCPLLSSTLSSGLVVDRAGFIGDFPAGYVEEIEEENVESDEDC